MKNFLFTNDLTNNAVLPTGSLKPALTAVFYIPQMYIFIFGDQINIASNESHALLVAWTHPPQNTTNTDSLTLPICSGQ